MVAITNLLLSNRNQAMRILAGRRGSSRRWAADGIASSSTVRAWVTTSWQSGLTRSKRSESPS